MSYDKCLETRLYVDPSPIGTWGTVVQKHHINNEDVWCPVNYTSRAWTHAEAGYGQIERESNGILTGMHMKKMYTLGIHIKVVTDHALLPAYNVPNKPKQLRVDRHCTKLLPFQYTIVYDPGKITPCDYGSCHPPPNTDFTEEERVDWATEDETDIFVNRVIQDQLPQAITLEILRAATAIDLDLQLLKEDIIPNKTCHNHLVSFHKIFHKLSYIKGIIMRGSQAVILTSLQAEIIGLAHKGHMGADKTLNLLRQSCWFPNMGQLVREYVRTCLPCAAAVSHTPLMPLKPNLLPECPWQILHAAFKGPIGEKYYLHVVIDQYSKYPKVDIVSSTSFSKLEPCLDRIIATHGIQEQLTTDNGSPYFSNEIARYAKRICVKHHPSHQKTPKAMELPRAL